MINTHNSVFDEEGELRKKELVKLNDFMMKEYRKGNYVIAGGDWNQNPRGSEMNYQKGKTKTTIIDFFVVSPNVIVESVKTIKTGFENSDHQPVIMKIKITG